MRPAGSPNGKTVHIREVRGFEPLRAHKSTLKAHGSPFRKSVRPAGSILAISAPPQASWFASGF